MQRSLYVGVIVEMERSGEGRGQETVEEMGGRSGRVKCDERSRRDKRQQHQESG